MGPHPVQGNPEEIPHDVFSRQTVIGCELKMLHAARARYGLFCGPSRHSSTEAWPYFVADVPG